MSVQPAPTIDAQDSISFVATPTMERFMLSESYIRLLAGPIGSGKSVTCVHELIRWATEQKPNSQGIRKTRFLIVRNTADQLRSTTLKTVFDWIPPSWAGTWSVTEKTFYIEFGLPDGTVVNTEWMAIPLDNPDDVRKALSLEATGLWGNESRELHPDVVDGLLMRVNRYPSMKDGGPTRPGAIFDTNYPQVGGWWFEKMSNPPSNWDIHTQPPAVLPVADWQAKYGIGRKKWQRGAVIIEASSNSNGQVSVIATRPEQPPAPLVGIDVDQEQYVVDHEADNFDNLNPSYYPNTLEGKTKEFINVYLRCLFGQSKEGRPVFEGFRRDFHVAKNPLTPIDDPSRPLLIGMDFGLCYSDDMEVLTSDGWKLFKDVDEHVDQVATLNPNGFGLEYTPINFKVEYDYEGELIEFKGQNFDFMVTPEHRTPFTRRDSADTMVFASAEELAGSTSTHNYIQLKANWTGQPIEWQGLKGDQAAAFLGWYLSEGSTEAVGNSRRVAITQIKQCSELDNLITENTWWPGTVWRKNAAGWRATVPKHVGDALQLLGKSWAKYVPAEVLDADPDAIRTFLHAYALGDGHIRTKAKKNSGVGRKARFETTLATVSHNMADHLQELALKAGWCSSIRVQKARTAVMRCGRQINCSDIFIVTIKKLERAEINSSHIQRVQYKGKIYCLNVPYHTLYVRRNGRPCWNGNTPACTISQQDVRGRLLTFAELTSSNMGIYRFITEKLKPMLADRFYGMPVIVIGDPAGVQRAQTDEATVYDILRQEGFIAQPAPTNKISRRISAVEKALSQVIDATPAHLIDASCKNLITAFSGGYRYRMKRSGEMEDMPEKNSFSHLMDGHQYTCTYINEGGSSSGQHHNARGQRREVQRTGMSGWM